MYVIIIGMGQVGQHVLQVLETEQQNVVAVDNSPDVVESVEENHDVMTLVGYGASTEVLAMAGVSRADLVVAVSNHDEANILAAITAKQMGAKRVIARAQGDAWADSTATGVTYNYLGVDVLLNPRVLVAQEIVKIARSHGALEVVDLAADRIEMVKMKIDKGSRMLHKPLSKLTMPGDTLVAAVVRDGELFVPGGADVLLPDDYAYLVGEPEHMEAAEDLFSSAREARRVTIVGGGVIGQATATSLIRDGTQVTIIEHDRERAEKLGSQLKGVTVIHGDGTNLNLLMEEEIQRSDLFAAVTSEDEINLMAALLARRLGVNRTVALSHRPDYVEIYRELGVDVTLSPRVVASDHVLRYSRSGVQAVASLEDGKAEVLEIEVSESSRVAGLPISSQQLNFPRGAIICGIIRGGDVRIPGGDDTLQVGDVLLILTTKAARSAVTRLFKPRVL